MFLSLLLFLELENDAVVEDTEDGVKEAKNDSETEKPHMPTYKEKIQKVAEPPPLQGLWNLFLTRLMPIFLNILWPWINTITLFWFSIKTYRLS